MIGSWVQWQISHISWSPKPLQKKNGDQVRWKLKKNGGFHIRFHYKALQISPSVTFPWKDIWRVKAPKRVSIFVWTVAWVKILIGDNLRRKGFIFVDRCCMCQCCGGES